MASSVGCSQLTLVDVQPEVDSFHKLIIAKHKWLGTILTVTTHDTHKTSEAAIALAPIFLLPPPLETMGLYHCRSPLSSLLQL